MDDRVTLQSALAAPHDPLAAATVATVLRLAEAAKELSFLIAAGPLAGLTGETLEGNASGDFQKDIDVAADRLISDALRNAPVAALLSEEGEAPQVLDPAAPVCVAVDPLDGSANLANNISVGTIFSIRPRGSDAVSTFFEPGTAQHAAGFFVYGPQTVLVLAIDHRVDLFILDPATKEFILVRKGLTVSYDAPEFAINMSNRRHWNRAVRAYVDECKAGEKGELARDFNMRWIGSLVAEAYRILVRGGVFLYPADSRPGYREGRLRLVYEAHPMALVMEWAGGEATDGRTRILDLSARTPHQRAPLVMGSPRWVRDIGILHEGEEPLYESSDAPLFARRGLFR